MSLLRLSPCLATLVMMGVFATARADEFVLAGGGRIAGELANASESPRTKYEIQVAGGGTITLAADQVVDVVRRSADEAEYRQVRHTQPDTAAGHLALADWCRDHKLADRRRLHLERVIELEPNNEKARAALGYNRIQGQWRTRAEHLSALGKVQYKGQWRYPQEIAIMEAKQNADQSRQLWYGNLKKWRSWIGGDKHAAAVAAIEGVVDPAAFTALKEYLEKEQDEHIRRHYVVGLAKIGTAQAEMYLADRSLNDPSEEVRLTCLDLLDDVPQAMLVDFYIQQLNSKDNAVVNRAAVALSRMKDARCLGPLIDSLVTTHKFAVTTGNAGGGLSATAGSGGPGLSMGSSTRIVSQKMENHGVLDALVTLLGGKVNYRFDVTAWKHWYAGQKKMKLLDVRRS